jgi:hypothetical protein
LLHRVPDLSGRSEGNPREDDQHQHAEVGEPPFKLVHLNPVVPDQPCFLILVPVNHVVKNLTSDAEGHAVCRARLSRPSPRARYERACTAFPALPTLGPLPATVARIGLQC